MTTQTPTRKGRTIAMAAAIALAGSAFAAPAMVAQAANITAPAAPTKTEANGWKSDSFTVVEAAGVKWTYKVGDAAAKDVTAGTAIKPFAASKTKPASGDVTVIATPTTSGDTIGDAATKEYTVKFDVDLLTTVTPKAPTLKVDKTSTFSTVVVPYVKGVEYDVTEYGGQSPFTSTVNFKGGTKAVTLEDLKSTTKRVQIEAFPADGYQFDPLKIVPTSFTLRVKRNNQEVKLSEITKPVAQDVPGTKDWVDVTGVEGIQWMSGTKKINVKPGKVVKVALAKGSTEIPLKATPIAGWSLKDGDNVVEEKDYTQSGFTALSEGYADVDVDKLNVYIWADMSVKTWTFVPDGSTKGIKITFPKNVTELGFTAPGKGELVADAAPGWTFYDANGKEANKLTWVVTDEAPAQG